jgi:hypothetical protein
MTTDVSKDIDLDTVLDPEPEEPATPAPKEGEGNIEEAQAGEQSSRRRLAGYL